jgi:hypothetical protein
MKKKTTSKKKVTRKKVQRTSALVPIRTRKSMSEDFMQEYGDIICEDATAATGDVSWAFIKTRGGVFEFDGEEIGEVLSVIVLESICENRYWGEGYDRSNPTPPVCFAMNKNPENLAPPENLETKQAEKCSKCPMNKFRTAERGRGKACRNNIRLTVLPAGEPLNSEQLSRAEGATLRIPATGLKNFSKYTRKVTKWPAKQGRPLLSVVTEISIERYSSNGWGMQFEVETEINDGDTLRTIIDRRKEGHASLMVLPVASDPDEISAPTQRRRKVMRKKAKRRGEKVKCSARY